VRVWSGCSRLWIGCSGGVWCRWRWTVQVHQCSSLVTRSLTTGCNFGVFCDMTPFRLVDRCVSVVFSFAIFRVSALFLGCLDPEHEDSKRLPSLSSSLHGVMSQKTSSNIGLSTMRLFRGVLFVIWQYCVECDKVVLMYIELAGIRQETEMSRLISRTVGYLQHVP